MKKKYLALLTVFIMTLNIVMPCFSFVKAVEKVHLEILQIDSSGMNGATSDALKVTINGNTTICGSFSEDVDLGSNLTIEYIPPQGYEIDYFGYKYDEEDKYYYSLAYDTNTYTTTLNEADVDYKFGVIAKATDGTKFSVEARDVDFGWHAQNELIDYEWAVIINDGDNEITDFELQYDESKWAVEQSSGPAETLEQYASLTYDVTPKYGAFSTSDVKQIEQFYFVGKGISNSGQEVNLSFPINVKIGISEDGSDPHNIETILNVTDYVDLELGDELIDFTVTCDDENVEMVPEKTYWVKLNEDMGIIERTYDTHVGYGEYHYEVTFKTKNEIDKNNPIVTINSPNYVPRTIAYVDDWSDEEYTYVSVWIGWSIYNEAPTTKYTLTFDANGGTFAWGFDPSYTWNEGFLFGMPTFDEELLTPPQGKEIDYYSIDGVRYNIGDVFTFNKNATAICIWKDKSAELIPITQIDITLSRPDSGQTNRVVDGTGTIHPSAIPGELTYQIDSAEWVKGTHETAGDSCMDIFEGTFEANNYYYAMINISAKDGYKFADNVRIRVNQEQPVELFGIYNGNSTVVIAKISARNAQFLKGDLDRNNVVDANDASIALEIYKAENATREDIQIGDMDNNNLIDANDASLILELYKTNN